MSNHREHREHRDREEWDKLTEKVIGCAINVHRELGPGLLEKTYQQCLSYELSCAGIAFEMECSFPVLYKDVKLDCGYRIDLLIEKSLIVELKTVEEITDLHRAQILSYMKLASIDTGLLINFNVYRLIDGIQRFRI